MLFLNLYKKKKKKKLKKKKKKKKKKNYSIYIASVYNDIRKYFLFSLNRVSGYAYIKFGLYYALLTK